MIVQTIPEIPFPTICIRVYMTDYSTDTCDAEIIHRQKQRVKLQMCTSDQRVKLQIRTSDQLGISGLQL